MMPSVEEVGLRQQRWVPVALGTTSVVLAVLAYRLAGLDPVGRWPDYCRHRFGTSHGLLVAAALLGVASLTLGVFSMEEFGPSQSRVRAVLPRIGAILGFLALVGAIGGYVFLTSNGCGRD